MSNGPMSFNSTRDAKPANAQDARSCPGCRLQVPKRDTAVYDGYFHTSPECWLMFTEVIGREFGNAPLFAKVHQLTSDTYAVQHAGGQHPDKSVAIHLAGLYWMIAKGIQPDRVSKLHQRLAAAVKAWPHFDPPTENGPLTILDIFKAEAFEDHVAVVHAWSTQVWRAWTPHHTAIADFTNRHLELAVR